MIACCNKQIKIIMVSFSNACLVKQRKSGQKWLNPMNVAILQMFCENAKVTFFCVYYEMVTLLILADYENTVLKTSQTKESSQTYEVFCNPNKMHLVHKKGSSLREKL